jgi:LPXTG-site transpeptidase (sortase) family protein
MISQWPVIQTYYETWVQRLPQRQVLDGVSQSEIELKIQQQPLQAADQDSSVPLLPSYTEDNPVGDVGAIDNSLNADSGNKVQSSNQVVPLNQRLSLAPDRLVIPAIQVDAEVIEINPERINTGGASQLVWQVPPYEKAGWHSSSAGIGIPGNVVINAHNYPQDAIFRNLYKLLPGDEIKLYAKKRMVEYVVVEILILPEEGQSIEVRQANARYIQPTNDERLTLVTCHPYASLANRLVVIAVPSDVLVDIMN